MKQCRKCKELKKSSEFYREKRNLDGLHSFCKKCSGSYMRNKYKNDPVFREKAKAKTAEWAKNNRNNLRNRQYQRYYGITLEQYNEMLKKQNNSCDICGKHESSFKRPLSVDHSHESGDIRGLLCSNCNFALGSVKENVEVCQNLIRYISKFK